MKQDLKCDDSSLALLEILKVLMTGKVDANAKRDEK
jgi:hypothetical protein